MKLYTFECRNHPEQPGTEQTKGTLSFEVRSEAELAGSGLVYCPVCGKEAGVVGPWREAPTDATAEDWRSKWSVTIGIWEKVATEAGNVKRKLSEASAELISLKTGLKLSAPKVGPEGAN